MADAVIRFNVDGHEDAGNAFTRIAQLAREAGQAFGESGESFTSGWGKFSEALGPLEGLFGKMTSVIGPAGLEVAALGTAALVAGKELFDLGQQATEAGAAIAKTALIMNENAAAVSDMQFAWKAAGGDLDKLNTIVFMFEQRIENSSDKVSKGFKDLGLNLNDFASATTTDKILAVSDAMRHAGDDTNVAAAAFEIFGRGARTSMTELMGPLAEMAKKSKEIGQTWSDDDAKAALEFEHSLSALKTQTDVTWTALGKDFAPISEAFVYAWDRMKLAVANVAYAFDQAVTGFGYFKAAWDTFISSHQEDLPKVASSTKGIIDSDNQMFGLAAKGLKDYTDHASGAADLAADLNGKMSSAAKELREELKESHEQFVKQQAERKRVGEELQKVEGEFATDTMNWVDKVGNHRLEAIAGWKEGGSKVFDDMFKLEREYATGTMDWISKVANTRDDSDIKFAAHESRVLDEAQRMWTNHYAFVESRGQSTSQRQITEVNRWYQNEVDKARQAGISDQIYYDGLAQMARDKMQAVRDEHDITFQAVRNMQDDLTIGWQQHFSDTLSKGDFSVKGFANAFEGVFATMKQDVTDIFSGLLTNIISGFLQPLLDNVTGLASHISSMLISALSGDGGGDGGPMSWVSGSVSGATPSLLGKLLGGSAFAGLAAGGGTGAGAGVSFSATTGIIGGGGTGGGIGGAVGGAAHGLATVATFLATNPIGWAIDAGIGALALWNHFSGPDANEVAGREVVTTWEDDIWKSLSPAQKAEAAGAGWANAKDAGAMVWMRTVYQAKHRANPEQSASNYLSNVYGSITKGYSGTRSAIQDVDSFDMGGVVPGPLGAPRAAIVHGGETVRTPQQEASLSMDAVHLQIVGLRSDLRAFMRTQPTMLRHALRGV